jgi:hypothetical protein
MQDVISEAFGGRPLILSSDTTVQIRINPASKQQGSCIVSQLITQVRNKLSIVDTLTTGVVLLGV